MCSPDPSSGSISGSGLGGAAGAQRGAGRARSGTRAAAAAASSSAGSLPGLWQRRGEALTDRISRPESTPCAHPHTQRLFPPARGQGVQRRSCSSLCVAPVWPGLPREHRLLEEPPGGEGKKNTNLPQTLWFLHPLPSFPKPAWTAEPAAQFTLALLATSPPEGGWRCFAGGWHCGWPGGLSAGSLLPALALIMTTLTISLKRIKPRR